MPEQKDEKIDYQVLRQGLYGDALSEKTEKVDRNLLLVATATLLVSVSKVTAKTTALVPIDFSTQPNSLVMFLAVANAALVGAYLFRLVPDLLRAQEEWKETRILVELDNIEQEARFARATERKVIANQVAPDSELVDEWWEDYQERAEEIRERIYAMELRLADRRGSMWFRNIRLYTVAIFPLLVGVVALLHTLRNIIEFFAAIVGL